MADLSREWTPGPWEMGQTSTYEEALVAPELGRMVAYAAWDGGSGCHLRIENEADARLIAAAPELAEALHDLQQHVIKHACVWDAAENGSHHHPVWTKVSAALAKAQGGAK